MSTIRQKNLDVYRKKPVEVLRSESTKQPAKHLSSKKAHKVLRAHSRKHPVPPKLGELIELVNLLPPNMPTIRELVELTKVQNKNLFPLIRQEIERLPEKLFEFVGAFPLPKRLGGNLADGDPALVTRQYEVSKRYDFLVLGKRALIDIARWLLPGKQFSTLFSHEMTINNKGRLAFVPTPLGECLEDVEPVRIRECPICDKIYWAERMDQPACSKRCNNIRRSRIQRGTYEES